MMGEPENSDEGLEMSSEDKTRRTRRSIAIGLGLLFLVTLFYVMTVFKLARF